MKSSWNFEGLEHSLYVLLAIICMAYLILILGDIQTHCCLVELTLCSTLTLVVYTMMDIWDKSESVLFGGGKEYSYSGQ